MRRSVPSESLTVMPLRSTSVTIASSWISTPIFSSRAAARWPSFSPIDGSTAGAASSRITRALVESMCRNAPFRVWSANSAICPAISTPVGPAPTTVNVSSLLAPLRIAGPFGLLEGAQNPAPQLERVVDRLHAGRELGEMVVAEVRLAGAGGDDQGVVGGFVAVAEQLRDDDLVREIDVGDVAEQHLDVALLAQHHPGGGGDFTLGDDPGGHLVQQRLKQVMGGAGDQLDVDVGALEFLCRVESAESRSDDDDSVTTRCFSCDFWLGAHVRLLLTGLLGARNSVS